MDYDEVHMELHLDDVYHDEAEEFSGGDGGMKKKEVASMEQGQDNPGIFSSVLGALTRPFVSSEPAKDEAVDVDMENVFDETGSTGGTHLGVSTPTRRKIEYSDSLTSDPRRASTFAIGNPYSTEVSPSENSQGEDYIPQENITIVGEQSARRSGERGQQHAVGADIYATSMIDHDGVGGQDNPMSHNGMNFAADSDEISSFYGTNNTEEAAGETRKNPMSFSHRSEAEQQDGDIYLAHYAGDDHRGFVNRLVNRHSGNGPPEGELEDPQLKVEATVFNGRNANSMRLAGGATTNRIDTADTYDNSQARICGGSNPMTRRSQQMDAAEISFENDNHFEALGTSTNNPMDPRGNDKNRDYPLSSSYQTRGLSGGNNPSGGKEEDVDDFGSFEYGEEGSARTSFGGSNLMAGGLQNAASSEALSDQYKNPSLTSGQNPMSKKSPKSKEKKAAAAPTKKPGFFGRLFRRGDQQKKNEPAAIGTFDYSQSQDANTISGHNAQQENEAAAIGGTFDYSQDQSSISGSNLLARRRGRDTEDVSITEDPQDDLVTAASNPMMAQKRQRRNEENNDPDYLTAGGAAAIAGTSLLSRKKQSFADEGDTEMQDVPPPKGFWGKLIRGSGQQQASGGNIHIQSGQESSATGGIVVPFRREESADLTKCDFGDTYGQQNEELVEGTNELSAASAESNDVPMEEDSTYAQGPGANFDASNPLSSSRRVASDNEDNDLQYATANDNTIFAGSNPATQGSSKNDRPSPRNDARGGGGAIFGSANPMMNKGQARDNDNRLDDTTSEGGADFDSANPMMKKRQARDNDKILENSMSGRGGGGADFDSANPMMKKRQARDNDKRIDDTSGGVSQFNSANPMMNKRQARDRDDNARDMDVDSAEEQTFASNNALARSMNSRDRNAVVGGAPTSPDSSFSAGNKPRASDADDDTRDAGGKFDYQTGDDKDMVSGSNSYAGRRGIGRNSDDDAAAYSSGAANGAIAGANLYFNKDGDDETSEPEIHDRIIYDQDTPSAPLDKGPFKNRGVPMPKEEIRLAQNDKTSDGASRAVLMPPLYVRDPELDYYDDGSHEIEIHIDDANQQASNSGYGADVGYNLASIGDADYAHGGGAAGGAGGGGAGGGAAGGGAGGGAGDGSTSGIKNDGNNRVGNGGDMMASGAAFAAGNNVGDGAHGISNSKASTKGSRWKESDEHEATSPCESPEDLVSSINVQEAEVDTSGADDKADALSDDDKAAFGGAGFLAGAAAAGAGALAAAAALTNDQGKGNQNGDDAMLVEEEANESGPGEFSALNAKQKAAAVASAASANDDGGGNQNGDDAMLVEEEANESGPGEFSALNAKQKAAAVAYAASANDGRKINQDGDDAMEEDANESGPGEFSALNAKQKAAAVAYAASVNDDGKGNQDGDDAMEQETDESGPGAFSALNAKQKAAAVAYAASVNDDGKGNKGDDGAMLAEEDTSESGPGAFSASNKKQRAAAVTYAASVKGGTDDQDEVKLEEDNNTALMFTPVNDGRASADSNNSRQSSGDVSTFFSQQSMSPDLVTLMVNEDEDEPTNFPSEAELSFAEADIGSGEDDFGQATSRQVVIDEVTATHIEQQLALLKWVQRRMEKENERRSAEIAAVQKKTKSRNVRRSTLASMEKVGAKLKTSDWTVDNQDLKHVVHVAESSQLGKPLASVIMSAGQEFGRLLETERQCARLGLISVGHFVQLSAGNEDVGGGRAESFEVYRRQDSEFDGIPVATEWDSELYAACDGDEDVIVTHHKSDDRVARAVDRLIENLRIKEAPHEDEDEVLLQHLRYKSARDESSSHVLEVFAGLLEKAVGSRAASELILDTAIDIRCFALRERARHLHDPNPDQHDRTVELAASLLNTGNALFRTGRPHAALAAYDAARDVKRYRIERAQRLLASAQASTSSDVAGLKTFKKKAQAALLPTLFNIGGTCRNLRDFSAAQKNYKDALALATSLNEKVACARAMQEQGLCIEQSRPDTTGQTPKKIKTNYDVVIAAYTAALAARRSASGASQAEVADTLLCRGRAYYKSRMFPQAISDQSEAVKIRRAALGEDHPGVATTITQLAFTLGAAKKYKDATKYADEALQIRSKTLGPHHPSFGAAAKFAAIMHSKLGDHSGARDRHVMAAECYKNLQGPRYAKKRSRALMRARAHSIAASVVGSNSPRPR